MAAVYIIERFRVCDYPLVNKKLETMVKKHLKKMLKGCSLYRIEAKAPDKFEIFLKTSEGMHEAWKLELHDSEYDELEAMCSYEYTHFHYK